ncbi:hydroxymethylglutaryl-CoA lyase [Rhizobiaceae bacterium n13]|uniref:Hydroxymethylglutaryl-CoA lyase n=1 Tax=Ferirhizobium litorale TaxID=2927786 RepID=A0AAE3QEG8_9HYPH|nr:hydroxymethylglutaryl-CoA lyase [Fererhizobium litorale]MDI7861797.1 hydroxymethylglutaryl-CoA lyase [Fererhizobium litorale]MDI7921861.1 hydroxymethylglutaryl-CoA lyase [Fererhizobium litorale]
MREQVSIVEVSPRDGLQNESRLVPAADKVHLVNLLSDCGFTRIEVTSFVSPKRVPQLADAAEVLAGITRRPGVTYTALAPNIKGYEAARAAGADEVAIFASASEGFSWANINCSVAESIERFRPVAKAAATEGIPVRGYVSCVVHCPYDGPTPTAAVARVVAALMELGCREVSLGDTIGRGVPAEIAAMLDAVLDVTSAAKLAGHYHDTDGHALDNIRISLERGLRVFDSSVAGLGGCPFAPGAKGNVDTLAVAAMLEHEGYDTGLDIDAVRRAAEFAARLIHFDEWS